MQPSRTSQPCPLGILALLLALSGTASANQIGRGDVAQGVMVNTCAGLSTGDGRNPGDVFSVIAAQSSCQAAQSAQPGGSVSAAASYSDPLQSVAGHGEGAAQWGTIHLGATFSGPTAAFFPVGFASGGWVDRMRIDALDPALQGTSGVLGVLVHLDGLLVADGPRASAGMQLQAYVNDQQGMVNGVNTSFVRHSITTEFSPSHLELVVDEIALLQLPFVFGTEFEFSLFADVITGTPAFGSDLRIESGQSNFLNTFSWRGIDSVTHNGLATSYRISSSSGTDWTQAFDTASSVPEPGSMALLAAGIGALALRRLGAARERRGRAGRPA